LEPKHRSFQSLRRQVVGLAAGFVLVYTTLIVLTPILQGLPVGGLIVDAVFFGYIFGAILYVEKLRSKHFWRSKTTITVLLFSFLIIALSVMVIVAGGI
jgi:hypothetical protein